MLFFKKHIERFYKSKKQQKEHSACNQRIADQLFLSVDICRYVNNILYIEGWALPASEDVEIKVYLGKTCFDGLECGISRPDVASAYSDNENAANSGFRCIVACDCDATTRVALVLESDGKILIKQEVDVAEIRFPVQKKISRRLALLNVDSLKYSGGRLIIAGVVAPRKIKNSTKYLSIVSLELVITDQFGGEWKKPVRFPCYPLTQPDSIVHHIGFYVEYWTPARTCHATLQCRFEDSQQELFELGELVVDCSEQEHIRSLSVGRGLSVELSELETTDCEKQTGDELKTSENIIVQDVERILIIIFCYSLADTSYLHKIFTMLTSAVLGSRSIKVDVQITLNYCCTVLEKDTILKQIMSLVETIDGLEYKFIESKPAGGGIGCGKFARTVNDTVNNPLITLGLYDYFLHLSPKVVPHHAMLTNFLFFARNTEGKVILEGRRLPSDVSKNYDEVSLETEWVTSECCLIPVPLFQSLGGFDVNLSQYVAVVDFCWRAKQIGGGCYRVPDALYFYTENNEKCDLFSELSHLKSSYFLGCKYKNDSFAQTVFQQLGHVMSPEQCKKLQIFVQSHLNDANLSGIEEFMTFDDELQYCQRRW